MTKTVTIVGIVGSLKTWTHASITLLLKRKLSACDYIQVFDSCIHHIQVGVRRQLTEIMRS